MTKARELSELAHLTSVSGTTATVDGTIVATTFTGDGSSLTGVGTFKPTSVTGATPSLNVGTFNFFDSGSLTANTTVSFASVPTNANWKYSYVNNYISNSYDLSTAVYKNALESLNTQDSDPSGVFFKPDGLKMYISGFQYDKIYEYNLSVSFDITTAVYSQDFSVASQATRPDGLFFKPDGYVMYMIGSAPSSYIFSYNLSTAWDISTAVYYNGLDLQPRDSFVRAVHFKSDGTSFYRLGGQNDRVEEYTMTTAWNVSTGSYSGQSLYVGGTEGSPNGLFINPLGTKIFIVGAGGDSVYEYTLSTAFLFSSATLTKTFGISSKLTEPQGMTFSTDGYLMFVIGNTPQSMFTYTVGTGPTITLPATVVGNLKTPLNKSRVTYEFFTLDGGTTVNLIGEEII